MISPAALPQVEVLTDGPARTAPTQRIGYEIELIAPRGASRADLAHELARRCGGTVQRFFHTDSEPSLVPGMDHFIHLTLGFAVLAADGAPLCRLVDDITLRQDLDPQAPAPEGWYRLVSDEPRLMRLVHRWVDPNAPLHTVLDPLAEVFGVPVEHVEGIAKLDDSAGATIAMAAPLPGERERGCEIITPPISQDHEARLEQLLAVARELGFTVPAEAAVHLHLDAAPLRQVHTFANLVRLFSAWREPLWRTLGTNPRCRRLAPLPAQVVDLVSGRAAAAGASGSGSSPDPGPRLPERWSELCGLVAPLGLAKYADVNLTSLITPRPDRDTVEIRCLPGSTDSALIARQSLLIELVLDRCRDPRPLPAPSPGARLQDLLS